MAFEKGREKTGGRKKGTPNRYTKEIRDLLKSIYEKELENIDQHLASLEPKERLDFIIKITPYVLPKVNNIHMGEGEPFTTIW